MNEKELWQLDDTDEVQSEIKEELEEGGERLDKLLFIGQRNLQNEIARMEKRVTAIVTLVTVLSSVLSIAVAL